MQNEYPEFWLQGRFVISMEERSELWRLMVAYFEQTLIAVVGAVGEKMCSATPKFGKWFLNPQFFDSAVNAAIQLVPSVISLLHFSASLIKMQFLSRLFHISSQLLNYNNRFKRCVENSSKWTLFENVAAPFCALYCIF